MVSYMIEPNISEEPKISEERSSHYRCSHHWSLRHPRASVALVAHGNYILQHSKTQPLTDYFYVTILWYAPIQAAVQFKTKVCSHSNAGIAGSNTADGMGFCV